MQMTAEKLLEYNVFGIISVTRQKIVVNATAVSGHRSITRSVIEDLDDPLESVGPAETAVIAFGAWLEPGQKSRITAHEINSLEAGPASELPEVGKVLSKVLDMVRAGYSSGTLT